MDATVWKKICKEEKMEEGRRKKEEGRWKKIIVIVIHKKCIMKDNKISYF